ncbi:DUF3530 family protein [Pseudomonas sp. CAU 1711]|uniref:DUF3530 family protein n=1 Tax=Pseudomonas sp. CAU 1711 TaxID=3140356 RepID=UPI003261B6CB
MRRPASPTLIALLLSLALPALAEEAASPADSTAPTPPEQSEEPQRLPLEERSADSAEALERQLPKGEQQMLQAEGSRFLALWKAANAPEAKGVVILIPGANETADWPLAINPLRSKLPDIGWSSLSLSLPDSPQEPLPEAVLPRAPEPITVDTAASATEAGAEAEDETEAEAAPAEPTTEAPAAPPMDPAQRVFARIDAGIAFAEQQDAKHLVLLGHGAGAYWAALYLKERKPERIARLAVVAPQLPGGQTPPLDELIPNLELATGDFFYKDQGSERSAAARRMQASKRLGHDGYTQVALQALPGNREAEQEQLFRRVRGWLEKQ